MKAMTAAGGVIERRTNIGDVTGSGPLLMVGDITQQRVDFS